MTEYDAVFIEDSDVEVGHEDQHAPTMVRPAHPDMVELGSVAQREAPTALVW
ncbi:MAG: hypothetical protein ACLP62_03400 [Acidimicrobiales bacterium]